MVYNGVQNANKQNSREKKEHNGDNMVVYSWFSMLAFSLPATALHQLALWI